MITEDYVSFEIAKLLKERGFKGDVQRWYVISAPEEGVVTIGFGNEIDYAQAPTLQMTMKWLRERNWFICIIPLAFYCGEKAVKFGYNIWADDNLEVDEFSTPKFSTYEEACEAAIKYCLENLI